MTRRDLLLGAFLAHRREGFEVSGHFERAGADPRYAYFSIQQTVALMIDPDKAPAMVQGAEALIGKHVRLILERA